MSGRTDGVLAVVALGAFVGGLVVVDAPFSVPFFVAGSLGTLAFEAAAFGRAETVRRYWERSIVRAGALVGAVVLAGAGVVFAPSSLLSAGIGALVTYLIVLTAVVAR